MLYSFNDAKAKDRHITQYFEMFGNRAIYHDGWLARTIHRAPWQTVKQKPLESDVWDLYDVRSDFSLAENPIIVVSDIQFSKRLLLAQPGRSRLSPVAAAMPLEAADIHFSAETGRFRVHCCRNFWLAERLEVTHRRHLGIFKRGYCSGADIGPPTMH